MAALRPFSFMILLAAGFALTTAPLANAADVAPTASTSGSVKPATEDWYVTIGASGILVPQYPGGDTYRVRPGVIFSLSKASDLNSFHSVDDNPSVALFDTGTFRIGAAGRIDWGRDEDDADRLTGLGNVDPSLEVGGFTEWYPVTWLRLRGELRYGFGGYEGWVGDLGADVIVPYQTWHFAIGPRLAFASSAYQQAYFGVTPFQALSANFLGNPLPVYEASSGLYSWGITAQLTKEFGRGFTGGLFGTYGRLVGDAADSPLVENANQFTAGISLSYTFNVGKSWW
ncbi:MipA/OmpV family protein [Xanthobacter sp. DSM 24535]|uniref:MipA/OmpV family protein n=1 Tax=Roseixanthobacter psychrophilus TaxID=3119917 RepID=UPI00372C5C88